MESLRGPHGRVSRQPAAEAWASSLWAQNPRRDAGKPGQGLPEASCFSSPGLSFPPSKMGIMTQNLPPSEPVVRIQLTVAKVTFVRVRGGGSGQG